jgi:hypothetical protein
MNICGKDLTIAGRLVRMARIDGEGYRFFEDPRAAIDAIRETRPRPDILTFIQRLSDLTPQFPFLMEWDNMAVLPVSSYHNWITNQIDFKVRNKVRKVSKAGVCVREVSFDNDLVTGISNIYNESQVRQGKPFWHYGKAFDEVRRMNATFMDSSVFIGAYFEETLIGFVKLVVDERGGQAGLMQILSMISQRDKAPTNGLVAQAVKSCADRGISQLFYANYSYGKKQQDSLADFKKHNGFQKVELPRYYVPLTLLGRVALRLGLHHRSQERVPEPLAKSFRDLRSWWYANRFGGTQAGRKETAAGPLPHE